MTSVVVSADPIPALEARKRRKEILASQKNVKRQRIGESEDDETQQDEFDSSTCTRTTVTICSHTVPSKKPKTQTKSTTSRREKKDLTSDAKVIKSDTKYQNRYEPEVSMTKEQETEWRKEARRQRNRQSAANSRNKVRNRIQELETEVEDWKTKYSTLMKRLDMLENKKRISSPPKQISKVPSASSPLISPICITPKTIYVPSCISSYSQEHCDLSIPLISDCASSTTSELSLSSGIQRTTRQLIREQNVTTDEDHHVIEITSRPAVKITDGDLQQIVTNVTNEWIVQSDVIYPDINELQLDFLSENSNGIDEYDDSGVGCVGTAKESMLDGNELDAGLMNLMKDALYDLDTTCDHDNDDNMFDDFDFNESIIDVLLE